ncbi:MAG: hypothetical protein FWC62_01195 [Firmicutes bacterium]|nr:hypothetical protein [Bacillota bacterium]
MGRKVEICVLALYVADSEGLSFMKVPVSKALAARYPVVPLRLCTRAGDVIIIDSVRDVSRVASLKAGGLGDRYTCLATLGDRQREIYVYKDEDKWFLEEEF